MFVVSDGTDTPAELVRKAAAAGLDVVGLSGLAEPGQLAAGSIEGFIHACHASGHL